MAKKPKKFFAENDTPFKNTDFSPNKFLNYINKRGDLAKPSKFYVDIIPTNGTLYSITNLINPSWSGSSTRYVCEAAELPGYNINPLESKIGALPWYVPSTGSVNEIQLTFLCTSTMEEKSLMDTWMREGVYRDGIAFMSNGSKLFSDSVPFAHYLDSCSAQIHITQFPDSGIGRAYDPVTKQTRHYDHTSYVIILEQAFPITMQALPLNWGDAEGVHRLQVTFRYSRLRRNLLDEVLREREVESPRETLDGSGSGGVNAEGEFETADFSEPLFNSILYPQKEENASLGFYDLNKQEEERRARQNNPKYDTGQFK